MNSTARARTVAQEQFGWNSLRPGQDAAIESIATGRDTLAVMPTGYGKSAIYQVAGVLLGGPTLVVSPLLALQADQVAAINEHDEGPDAVAVNSAQSRAGNENAWSAINEGDAEYLFLSPEQLARDEVIERLRTLDVRLFVVDEAHCVSSWGHDFRPDYLGLAVAIERLGHPPVLALTATGSPPVREEIVQRLGMREPRVLTAGFDRPNIRLTVVRHEDDAEKRRSVVESVLELPRPGLLYVATRRDTERYQAELEARGVSAVAYHGGLSAAERRRAHELFRGGGAEVVVATSAFGMGIDKANVRFVVHAAVPESPDSYYQEVGRAGRDGEESAAILHYRPEDLALRNFFASGSPDPFLLGAIYRELSDAGTTLRPAELAGRVGIPARSLARWTNLLQDARLVTSGRRGLRVPASVASRHSPAQAARLALEVAEERERIEQSRIAMMRAYAETRSCRRQFLLGYFGEQLDEPCGNCDTCVSGSAVPAGASEAAGAGGAGGAGDAAGSDVGPVGDDPFAIEMPVDHVEWGRGVVMHTEPDRITVFFDSEGYKVLSREAVDAGKLLSPVT